METLSRFKGLKTKAELIAEWLAVYPEDKDNPDLEQLALAGCVEIANSGFYMIWREYDAQLGNKQI